MTHEVIKALLLLNKIFAEIYSPTTELVMIAIIYNSLYTGNHKKGNKTVDHQVIVMITEPCRLSTW